MSLKSLLVHLNDKPQCKQQMNAAIRLALEFGARLVGVYLVPTLELTPSVAALLPDDVVARRLEETGAAQAEAEKLFRQAAHVAGLTAIEWRAPSGDPVSAAVAHARCADLTVIGQPEADQPDLRFLEELVQSVVLSSGRPTLIAPYATPAATLGQRVLVAWDGGREASRAVGDAIPILARAKQVTVMAIHREAGDRIADDAATSRLADYLRSHGIDVKVDHSSVEDISIGEWLLSRSADLSIDLIVMGAYAHTRLRELILGGVTRTMLGSMTVPVLMSH
jgi:nucleotide-binding universal stress UspA family protein